jgi:hypothetical protein
MQDEYVITDDFTSVSANLPESLCTHLGLSNVIRRNITHYVTFYRPTTYIIAQVTPRALK